MSTAAAILRAAQAEPEANMPVWGLPPAISAAELREARLTPRVIVENYLHADVAALIGQGGTSKTSMSLHEAICIVLGRDLWGQEVKAPGPVLIVTAEDRREFLVARLRLMAEALALSAVELARVMDGVRILDFTGAVQRLTIIAGDVVEVADFPHELVRVCLSADFHPALVQFDPMVSFGVGESRVNDAEQGLVHAGRVIVAGLDCAVRFVHHTGKASAREKVQDQYAGRGGSALADGCRMVHVMTAVDDAELQRATGESLAAGESAFMLARPKVTYAPPQTAPIYIKRTGYRFERLRALQAPTTEERAASMGEQVARFIAAELQAGRQHTRNTIEQLRPDNLTRAEVRTALAWLTAQGRLQEVPRVNAEGKRPATGARSYLTACRGEPMASPAL